jgi:hypothetical protein
MARPTLRKRAYETNERETKCTGIFLCSLRICNLALPPNSTRKVLNCNLNMHENANRFPLAGEKKTGDCGGISARPMDFQQESKKSNIFANWI